MANPFLFGTPAPSANEPPNPFLTDNTMGMGAPGMGAPVAAPNTMAANPFMTAQPAQAGGFFAGQAPVADAANPFASYGAQPAFQAPAYNTQSPFMTAQPPPQPPQNQQQCQGQFGQYTQVTADSTGQTEVTSSLANQAPPPPAASNPFAMAASTPEVVPTKVEAPSLPTPPPVQESVVLPTPPPVQESVVLPTAAIDEPPPPPPETVDREPPAPPTPPPVEEEKETAVTEEESLPPPPPPQSTVEMVDIQVPIVTEPEPPPSPPVVEDTPIPPPSAAKEEGFSGIFTSETKDANQLGVDSLAAAISTSDLNDADEEKDEKAVDSVDDSPKKESPEPAAIGGLGAALFGTSDAPMEGAAPGGTGANIFADLPSEDSEPDLKQVSTGDAIFSDIPSVPDYKSTGASIFGASEESASNTTGATLFDVEAPKEARPELGAMSGWDEVFDQKFDSVSGSKPVDTIDPFGGQRVGVAMTGTAAFGVEEDGFGGDDFSSQKAPKTTPLISRRANGAEENPFLAPTGDQENDLEDGPLFDDDTSQPLEAFPRVNDVVEGWEMYIRHPPKKKMTAQRFWKKIFVRLVMQGDNPCVQLFETKDSKDAFQELPLQAAYSLSDVSHQVFDQYSKIFTIKLQYIFYKERAGIRPGQVSKMQKLTGKLGFLAKAVEDADYQGVKEFASDMKKLGVPLEHAPQVSELLKLGSTSFDDLKQFSVAVEEKLFRMDALRDRSITYKTEEIQLNAVDEVYVEQTKTGHVIKQLCRVRVFFCSFLSGN